MEAGPQTLLTLCAMVISIPCTIRTRSIMCCELIAWLVTVHTHRHSPLSNCVRCLLNLCIFDQLIYFLVDHGQRCDDFSCSPVSRVDCGAPPALASGVTVEAYNSTAVNSDILFKCQQPSDHSASCGSDGRWSPDPSQVECRMPMPTDTTSATGV